MAIKNIKTIYKTRTDTFANFTASNIILKKGEMAFESDTRRFKIGDGTTSWNNLEYVIEPNSGIIKNLTTNIITDDYHSKFLSLEFAMSTDDEFNKKMQNGLARIKVYLYKLSRKNQTMNREAYNKWVHPKRPIGIFSKDFFDSIRTNIAEETYTMSYQAEEEPSVVTEFEIGNDFFYETFNNNDYYTFDSYNLSELARQMVFFTSSSSVCPAEFEKPGASNKIQSILNPRIQGYNECHVIGKRSIGRTALKYRFKLVVGDKEYWSNVIRIIYTYHASPPYATFGIRID